MIKTCEHQPDAGQHGVELVLVLDSGERDDESLDCQVEDDALAADSGPLGVALNQKLLQRPLLRHQPNCEALETEKACQMRGDEHKVMHSWAQS